VNHLTVKKVLLTGASSGIGRAIAEALIARGDEVWGSSRDAARIPQRPHLHPVQLDLCDSSSIANAFQTALAEAGHFDVVINNAGSGHFGPAENLSADDVTNQFQLLVFGHLQLLRLALKSMRERGSGLIINVTSLAARLPVPFMAAYNAAKAAMVSFTMSIQLELSNSGVRLVDLQPADICTPFNESVKRNIGADSRYEASMSKTWRAVERNMAAAPKPELVARHVLRLIDNDNPPPQVTVGDVFQSKIAPLLLRFLPQRVQIWGLKKYYGI
jgi:NAD(P)-dependent dehydrogenase (short-subunit alcohol dehydrogenase family)